MYDTLIMLSSTIVPKNVNLFDDDQYFQRETEASVSIHKQVSQNSDMLTDFILD